MLIGAEGVRLLAGKASQRQTPQAHSAEEAPGPPTEGERISFQSTGKFNKAFLLIALDSVSRNWTF